MSLYKFPRTGAKEGPMRLTITEYTDHLQRMDGDTAGHTLWTMTVSTMR